MGSLFKKEGENMLTTVDAVNVELGFVTGEDADRDARIERYIKFASDAFETLVDRKIAKAIYLAEKASTSNATTLYTKQYPILSIEELRINGNIAEHELINAEHEDSYIYNECGFDNSSRIFGDLTPTYYGERVLNAEIDYTAGYCTPQQAIDDGCERTLPCDIEEAVIEVAIIKYKQFCTDTQGLAEYKVGSRTIKFKDLFEGLYDDVVRRYRRSEQ